MAHVDLVEGAGAFEIEPTRDGPVDLQVGTLSALPGVTLTTSRTIDEQIDALSRDLPRPDRMIYSVDSLGGFVRGVEPGAQDVEIRLRPLSTHDVVIAVKDPSGAPVSGADVKLSSLSDYVRVTTDSAGRAAVPDIPLRRWSVIASVPSDRRDELLPGYATLEPEAASLPVMLVHGIPMFIRLVPEASTDVFIAYGEAGAGRIWTEGWGSGADGRMRVLARPEWVEMTISVQRVSQQTSNSFSSEVLATVTAPVGAGAIVEIKCPD